MRVRFCDKTFIELENTAPLDEYAQMLVAWNGLNLIAKSTESDIYGWHILDALSILPLIEAVRAESNCSIVDFGAGGGVLGVSLSRVGVSGITLVERSQSKVSFLKDILKFPSVEFDCVHVSQPILLLARGVSTINKTLEAANAKIDCAIFFKAYDVEKEIKEAKRYWKFEYKMYPRMAKPYGKIVLMKNISHIAQQ